MDVMKMEREVDPLIIGRSNLTDTVEGNSLSQEGNLSHMNMTGIKTECVDQGYDIKSEIKVEDIAPVPMSFIVVKSEVDEDLFDVGRVQQKQKVEVSSKEDEVLTESFGDNEKRVIGDRTGIDREKDNLTECDSKRPDCSNLFDVSRNCIKCHMCNEVFVSEQRLKVHFDIHTEIKSLRCNVYEESFSSSPNLKTDACMERGERPFKCNICGKGLTRMSDLNRHHVRIHTGQKPFKCELCGKCFSESAGLNRHVRIHRSKPFKCEECGKCFSESSNLKLHTRRHTGERPFKCDICGKSFLHGAGLNRHARIHTGQKPFKCEMCGKCFSQSGDLNKHVRIHTGQKPFKCGVCGKCFSESSNLIAHTRTHTGERPFKCDICGKCFVQWGSLNKHVRNHTG
ncbi:zinc finger protein 664-like isoform X3 [Periplaneta americana]|uniref:zinc finger protein 664-like isoform X3 n=1 Tax=Periplaneta americana TaxID=6978 RepID=UPI0037E7412C